jgi:hypothetical protein
MFWAAARRLQGDQAAGGRPSNSQRRCPKAGVTVDLDRGLVERSPSLEGESD